MPHEPWTTIALFAISNVFALVAGLIHIATRLTRIETDIKWIKAGCPKCQRTSEIPIA
jgi:fumarate hydratase class II